MNTHLVVLTPVLDGCRPEFVRSILDTQRLMIQMGIQFEFHMVVGDSLITRARNRLVHGFLKTNATHSLWIDADITWHPNSVLQLIHAGHDVIGVPYPKKKLNWAKVQAASAADVPAALWPKLAGEMIFTPQVPETENVTLNLQELWDVHELGTGFLMVTRKAYELLDERMHIERYQDDDASNPTFGETMLHYFDTGVGYGRLLSEDYWFSYLCREAGIPLKAAPWIHLEHTGKYTYKTNIPALISFRSLAALNGPLPVPLKEEPTEQSNGSSSQSESRGDGSGDPAASADADSPDEQGAGSEADADVEADHA